MIGTFPPPIHGMSLINENIRNQLACLEVQVKTIDLSALSLSKNRLIRFARILKVLKGLIDFCITLLTSRTCNIYIALSGGFGQLYDLTFMVLSRVYCRDIYLHHHSYAYLNKKNILTNILFIIAGKQATHIVLCHEMEKTLKKTYPSVKKTVVLSNAAILEKNNSQITSVKENLQTIGFLGNILPEKGINEFIDVIEQLSSSEIKINAKIAGPFQDKNIENLIKKRVYKLPNITYIGPVFGIDKQEFLKSIDVLLFPTRYRNEAEPLTIHEAMMFGVPVIAWERGCIASMITSSSGAVISQNNDYVSDACCMINKWYFDTNEFKKISKGAFDRFCEIRIQNEDNLNKLLKLISR